MTERVWVEHRPRAHPPHAELVAYLQAPAARAVAEASLRWHHNAPSRWHDTHRLVPRRSCPACHSPLGKIANVAESLSITFDAAMLRFQDRLDDLTEAFDALAASFPADEQETTP